MIQANLTYYKLIIRCNKRKTKKTNKQRLMFSLTESAIELSCMLASNSNQVHLFPSSSHVHGDKGNL